MTQSKERAELEKGLQLTLMHATTSSSNQYLAASQDVLYSCMEE